MPLSPLITQYIVRMEEKVNKSNLKVFCKPCIEDLGEEEGCKILFPNKTDCIIQHFKKCLHFLAKTNEEQRAVIFGIQDNSTNAKSNTIPRKRSCKYLTFKLFYLKLYSYIA